MIPVIKESKTQNIQQSQLMINKNYLRQKIKSIYFLWKNLKKKIKIAANENQTKIKNFSPTRKRVGPIFIEKILQAGQKQNEPRKFN